MIIFYLISRTINQQQSIKLFLFYLAFNQQEQSINKKAYLSIQKNINFGIFIKNKKQKRILHL